MPPLSASTILIVSALSVERDALLKCLPQTTEVQNPVGPIYRHCRISGRDIFVAEIGAGNPNAALECDRAIQFTKATVALFVGVAGGVKDVAEGDVVVASKVYYYESGSDKSTFKPRPFAGLPSYPLLWMARANTVDPHNMNSLCERSLPNGIRVFIGPIAAGEKVVKATKGAVAKLLKANFSDSLAVEMEGLGFMLAVHSNSIDAIIVRGISDLLDGKEQADASGSQERASDNAAIVAFGLVSRILESSPDKLAASAKPGLSPLIEDFIPRSIELLARLYPRGPTDMNVWTEASGDLSRVDLNGDGRTQWSLAVRLLSKGGGGSGITFKKLFGAAENDFANNTELKYLLKVCP